MQNINYTRQRDDNRMVCLLWLHWTHQHFHTYKKNPEEAAKAINAVLSAFGDDKVTLYIPIGAGYAYRHYLFVRRLKEVIIEK